MCSLRQVTRTNCEHRQLGQPGCAICLCVHCLSELADAVTKASSTRARNEALQGGHRIKFHELVTVASLPLRVAPYTASARQGPP